MECEYRPYSCACGLAFQYRTRATHDLTCPINKIPCPAACGKTLERRQLVRHAAPGQCSASLTLCPYHLAGCAFASSPSAVADHQAGAKEQHLAMLSSALAQSAARNAAVRGRVGTSGSSSSSMHTHAPPRQNRTSTSCLLHALPTAVGPHWLLMSTLLYRCIDCMHMLALSPP